MEGAYPKNPSVESSPACVKIASPPGCSSTYEVTSYTYINSITVIELAILSFKLMITLKKQIGRQNNLTLSLMMTQQSVLLSCNETSALVYLLDSLSKEETKIINLFLIYRDQT